MRLEDRSYFVFRRYNEFHTLQEKLKKKFSDVPLKLPGKRILGNNFDPQFIQQRREGLHGFILGLLKVGSDGLHIYYTHSSSLLDTQRL